MLITSIATQNDFNRLIKYDITKNIHVTKNMTIDAAQMQPREQNNISSWTYSPEVAYTTFENLRGTEITFNKDIIFKFNKCEKSVIRFNHAAIIEVHNSNWLLIHNERGTAHVENVNNVVININNATHITKTICSAFYFHEMTGTLHASFNNNIESEFIFLECDIAISKIGRDNRKCKFNFIGISDNVKNIDFGSTNKLDYMRGRYDIEQEQPQTHQSYPFTTFIASCIYRAFAIAQKISE